MRLATVTNYRIPWYPARVTDENLVRWQELCRLAAAEDDPVKLVKLVAEINLLLAKKLDYLAANPPRNPKT
jgi:hypothetical protein